jgi:tetratricopeptide (TPR) repeat protein
MDLFKQAMRIKPAVVYYSLGSLLLEVGRVSEAIGEYQEALRIAPDYAKAHNNLGAALARMDRTSEAIDQYRQALRIYPSSADAHNNLGAALARNGSNSGGSRTSKGCFADQPQRYCCPKQSGKVRGAAENHSGEEIKI